MCSSTSSRSIDRTAKVTTFGTPLEICLAISVHYTEEEQGYVEKFFLQFTSPPGIVPHLSHSGRPSLTLLPFLTSGPDLGAWPDCWISTKFLHTIIPRKGSGSTTTTTKVTITTLLTSDCKENFNLIKVRLFSARN